MSKPPVIILVRPQLAQNIGAAARAMMNFGLEEMRLVAPRDGWPNPAAGPAAADADIVLNRARCFDTVSAAIQDCHRVFATTVRLRDMQKPVVTPVGAVREINAEIAHERRSAILFGPERSGLTNDDVSLADTVLTIPDNPSFSSINLAQAVIIIAYEWFQHRDEVPDRQPASPDPIAPKSDLLGLFEHLESALDERDYFRSRSRRPVQIRSIRNMLHNAELSAQEVQTLRGIIKALSGAGRRSPKRRRG